MKVFAFDLDGTLITAQSKQICALRAIAKRFDIVIDPFDAWEKKRGGLSNLRFLLDQGIDKEVAINISINWQEEIESPFWLSLDIPINDTFSCLSKVKKITDRCILVTARRNEFLLRQQLVRLQLIDFFSCVYCVNPKNAIEEKSIILKKTCAEVFFGDSETDFEAAKKSNASFFPICTGQRSEKFLNQYGIINVSSSLSDATDKAIYG